MRFGLLLVGGTVAITGLVGLALLSVAAEGVGSSLGALVSCAPTLPPDEDDEEDSDSSKPSSDT